MAFETDFGSKPAKRRAASKVRRKMKVSSSSSGSLASCELCKTARVLYCEVPLCGMLEACPVRHAGDGRC
jgi:hypothetical protein